MNTFFYCIFFCTIFKSSFSIRSFVYEGDTYFSYAREKCQNKGWKLIKIENKQDENELVEKLREFKKQRCWLDLKENIFDWQQVIGHCHPLS